MTTDNPGATDDAIPAGWEGILVPGEKIIWQGQPLPGLNRSEWLTSANIMPLFVAAFGVFWTITAVTMMSDARSVPGAFRLLFPAFGIFFVAMALWGSFGKMIKLVLQRRGTYYTLSNKAAYVAVNSGGAKTLQRYPFAEMETVMLDASHPGAVYFGSAPLQVRVGNSRRMRTVNVRIGFERIADARQVFAHLRELRDDQSGQD